MAATAKQRCRPQRKGATAVKPSRPDRRLALAYASRCALPQPHAPVHAHCGPHAQAACVAAPWHPQVQLEPGHESQPHGILFASFMRALLHVSWGWNVSALYGRCGEPT
jgi:hypothetical protein